MSPRTNRQLALMGEVTNRLETAGVPCWLDGGWALDFRLGRFSRDHDDIDLIIFSDDRRVAEGALAQAGYKTLVTPFPKEHQHFQKERERLSLTFVEHDTQDQLIVPGRWADWPFPAAHWPQNWSALRGSSVVF